MRERLDTRAPGRDTRVNEHVRAPQIRLIDETGKQLGEMPPQEAHAIARERGYDLVEVAPTARPPVCRIMDYGKYKYEQKKKKASAHRAAGRSRTASVKEVKMRPNTDDHDLEFKLRNARRFLLDGDKVKVTVMFRGREMAHRKHGYAKLEQVQALLGDLVNVENSPQMQGRFLSMVLVPNRPAVEALRRTLAEQQKQPQPQTEKAEQAGAEKPAEE